MRTCLIFFLICACCSIANAQKKEPASRYFGNAVLTSEKATTLVIPLRYQPEHLSDMKAGLMNDHYANVLFYDIKADSYKKLFPEDTFIEAFVRDRNHYNRNEQNTLANTSSRFIFYFVKNSASSGNSKTEHGDPAILYVSDKSGNNLQALTTATENAVSIEIFEEQGFGLLKMQRDSDNNKKFEQKDKDFYFVRINLTDLSFGKKIELNQ